MEIKDIMSKNVEIVSPETLLNEVAKKMQSSDCGSILVGQDDRLLGVITDRDLALRCVAESHHPAETTAAQVMTPEILYCYDTDNLEDVAANITKNRVRRMPVLDKSKRLVGIISLGDLAVHSTDEHHRICGKALGTICSSQSVQTQNEDMRVQNA
jgi:CBS domain-containing protein